MFANISRFFSQLFLRSLNEIQGQGLCHCGEVRTYLIWWWPTDDDDNNDTGKNVDDDDDDDYDDDDDDDDDYDDDYPANYHRSHSHQVGICHDDEGWEYDTVKFPPYT